MGPQLRGWNPQWIKSTGPEFLDKGSNWTVVCLCSEKNQIVPPPFVGSEFWWGIKWVKHEGWHCETQHEDHISTNPLSHETEGISQDRYEDMGLI